MRRKKVISYILSIVGVCALAPRIPAPTLASPHPIVIAASVVLDGERYSVSRSAFKLRRRDTRRTNPLPHQSPQLLRSWNRSDNTHSERVPRSRAPVQNVQPED
jgi:hypothetical protein